MKEWEKRPQEIAFLLNPAFCGHILLHCIKEYQRQSGNSFPYSLAFLVLPIALHQKTRENIRASSKHMHIWLQNNREALVGFPERAKSLVSITKESILFLTAKNKLSLTETGDLKLESTSIKKLETSDSEITDIIEKTKLIGKWLAKTDSVSTTFAMWGVKP